MTAMTIGFQSWAETRQGLQNIHAETERRGFRIDRYIMPIDRRMGIPVEDRHRAAKETGPMIESDQDWYEIGQCVAIQPHMGDMMIGSPMSVANTRRGLESGVNYIGNMGQFSWKYPSWRGTDIDQTAEAVKAIGLMASKRDAGAVVHDYLDDGFSAQFSDFSSYIGWALFDRHVVKTLGGANITVSYGGLTQNPVTKVAVILALEALKSADDAPTSFYYTTTTGLSNEIDGNYGALGVDTLMVMLALQRVGGGAAVNPVPVTEPLRVPSWMEIVEAHTIARRVAVDAERMRDIVDWGPIDELKDRLFQGGQLFFERMMNGLDEMSVNTDDPLQLLLAARRMGATEIERRWGAGKESDSPDLEGYEAMVPTDTLQDFLQQRRRVRKQYQLTNQTIDSAERIIVTSTDVHEFGMRLVADAVRAMGVEPLIAGTGVDPDELADLCLEMGATAILVSTHNGMALTYAQQLKHELDSRRLEGVKVLFGGLLNQDFEGSETPVDVSQDLRDIGMIVCESIMTIADAFKDPSYA